MEKATKADFTRDITNNASIFFGLRKTPATNDQLEKSCKLLFDNLDMYKEHIRTATVKNGVITFSNNSKLYINGNNTIVNKCEHDGKIAYEVIEENYFHMYYAIIRA